MNSNLFIDDVSLTNAAATVNAPVELTPPTPAQFVELKQAPGVDRSAPVAAPEARVWPPAATGQK